MEYIWWSIKIIIKYMAVKRIHWIDATKGILILLMVLGHIPNFTGRHGMDNNDLNRCLFFGSLYSCFFMQAFIILTGYTSNFEKKFKNFAISIIKTILVPWVFFSMLLQAYRFCSEGGNLFIVIDGQNYFFLIEDYWFLHVLLFGKILCYFLFKYIKSDVFRACILLVMMVCGFSMFVVNGEEVNSYHYYNYLHYKDFLCMTFFIWFGNYCRRKELLRFTKGKTLMIILSLFLLGHLVRFVFRQNGIDELLIAPVTISHGGNAISPLQIPAFIYYVVLGSLSCFGIMQYIEKSRLLEFFGRNSLVVYCVHFVFLNIIIEIVGNIVQPSGMVNALMFIIITMGPCLLSCVAAIYLTRYRPFNFVVGKF